MYSSNRRYYKKSGRRYNKSRYSNRKKANGKNLKLVTSVPRLMSTVNWMKNLLNSERKLVDTVRNSAMTAAEVYSCVTGVAQGDTIAQRSGQSLKADSIAFRYVLNNATGAQKSVRIVLFVDTLNIGSAPSGLLHVVNDVTSFLNAQDNIGRYTILYDKLHVFPANHSPLTAHGYCYKKLDFKCKFSGTDATDYDKNSIWVMVLSDGITSWPNIQYTTRFRFYDN